MQTAQTDARIQRNFSLDREHVAWIERRAKDEGHGNASRVLQRLIDLAAMQRDGIEWRDKFRDDTEAA
jgi:hypothetical protein